MPPTHTFNESVGNVAYACIGKRVIAEKAKKEVTATSQTVVAALNKSIGKTNKKTEKMSNPVVSVSEKDQLEINTAYRIKEQKIFQLKMRSQKWGNLDLSDSFTRNLIIEMDADESKLHKFNDDILRNKFDPRIDQESTEMPETGAEEFGGPGMS
ncbi:hypothetical protein B9Z55_008896 [Caenorhabditis nigoni]|uniref:Uncharacterized protein n=1 Tax=Caenorhabditis nigoni TaxID=1611254 RepID=A0A2G5UPR2_9PELO|nr:hypothetical protein B9Z55_008896 [Caenorhabditis nigoni]